MRYTPYTEAQIQSMNVMEEGVYAFQVLEVITTDKFNQPMRDRNGIDMAKLKLLVWDNENRERTLYTYISGDGNFAYKLRHFAKTLGMIEDYENGTFNIHRTVGQSGKADIVIKKGTTKADGSGEMWPDRNDVKDFVCDSPVRQEAIQAMKASVQSPPPALDVPQSHELDDDIPFN
jgi:hypothetical protein